MVYPNTTGFSKGSETSKAGAEYADEGARNKQLGYIEIKLRERGAEGLIAEEARKEFLTGGFDTMERAQASARLSDLCTIQPPRAYTTKRSRPSDVTGRQQMVVVHKDFATEEEIREAGEHKTSKREMICEELETCANFINALIEANKITDGAFAKRAPEIRDIIKNVISLMK